MFVGSSYGGAVAATCALDYPERVEKLVLVGYGKQQPAAAIQTDASCLARAWLVMLFHRC